MATPSRFSPVLLCVLLTCEFLPAVAAQADSLEKVIARLDSQLKSNSRNYEVLLQRAEVKLAADNLDEARRDFNAARLSESASIRARARLGLGDVYRVTPNRRWLAIREYRMAISADSTIEPDALYRITRTAFELRQTDGYMVACHALTRLIYLDPGYRDALDLWWNKIYIQSDNELLQVCRRLEQLVAGGNGNPDLLIYIARIRSRLHQPDSTLLAIDMLEKNDPNYKKSERSLLKAENLLELDDTLGFEENYNLAVASAAEEGDYTHLVRHAGTIFNPTEELKWDSLATPEAKKAFFNTFWLRRDPDPTTPHNERLLAHYRRLHKAQKEYFAFTPHGLENTSHDYFNLTAPRPEFQPNDPFFDREYTPEIWWDNNQTLALQQRGLFFIRHGEPDMLFSFGLPWEASMETPPYEAWRYGSTYFLFARLKEKGHPEGSYWPMSFNGAGDIMNAMRTETYLDPLINLPMADYGADFKGPGGKLEVEIYNSVPVSLDTLNVAVRQSTIAVYDLDWNEQIRRDTTPHKVFTGRDSMWIAVNRVLIDPGDNILALRMDIPRFRSVVRRELKTLAYNNDELDMSGFVLGSPPPPDVRVHRRWGMDLLPRPSLAFRQGEIITVYVEVYGLSTGPDGGRAFDEQVTVRLEGEMAEESIIRRIFGSRQPRTSLTLAFERHPDPGRGPFPEYFTVDTAELAPGDYSLIIGITDRNNRQTARRGCKFKLVE